MECWQGNSKIVELGSCIAYKQIFPPVQIFVNSFSRNSGWSFELSGDKLIFQDLFYLSLQDILASCVLGLYF